MVILVLVIPHVMTMMVEEAVAVLLGMEQVDLQIKIDPSHVVLQHHDNDFFHY